MLGARHGCKTGLVGHHGGRKLADSGTATGVARPGGRALLFVSRIGCAEALNQPDR